MPASSPPPSTSPVPPKKSGGGLILLGIVLLLLAGGAVFWKISQKPAEPEVTEVRVKEEPKEPAAPALNDAPPPPPPEEELAAAEPQTSAKAGSDGTKVSGPPGCSGECKGTASAELLSALRAKGGQARGCYNRALRLNSALEGKMTVSMRVSPTGQVCYATSKNDSLNDPAVTTCVLQMFRSGKFPAPTGGCMETAVPLNFVSKQ